MLAMETTRAAKPSNLLPIDWAGLELQYRAGVKPLRLIGKQFGCSHAAITKRAKRDGWQRDLKAKVHARADELVAKAVVSKQVSAAIKAGEDLTVEASAQAEVSIRLKHRADIARARRLAMRLMVELEAVTETPDLFGMVYDALACPDEPAIEALREMATLVASLPARVKVMKDLADTLHKLIGAEREAFGLNSEAGTDGRPLVIIRDYTGRRLPEPPVKPASYH